jgi:energy-coupling factor transport system substrate-specific component
MRSRRTILTVLLTLLFVCILALTFLWQNSYLGLSFGLVIITILFFFLRFENRKVEPRELVLLAVLAAIAAVGRVAFASIPNVQPTTFVIMMSGYVFGAESGFIIGAVAALASNMLLGQGPWTPWQMAAWGLVGLTAGWLRYTPLMNYKWGRICFGGIWGFLFGAIMNVWGLIGLLQTDGHLNMNAILLYFAGSFTFDAMHALGNVIFLLMFANTWIKIMMRFKRKYGLLERK